MAKTKEVVRKNGSKLRKMLCINSNPTESKWGEYAPEGGVCENWSTVALDATGVLCSECTERSVGTARQS